MERRLRRDLPQAGRGRQPRHRREVTIRYGADLEVFVEKQPWSNTVLRLTGSNLLNPAKEEDFKKFDDLGDQMVLRVTF